MQVRCPKCSVIATQGTTKWFFDGGDCRDLAGTKWGEAKEYQWCPTLSDVTPKNTWTLTPEELAAVETEIAIVCIENLNSDVLVMKAAEDRV